MLPEELPLLEVDPDLLDEAGRELVKRTDDVHEVSSARVVVKEPLAPQGVQMFRNISQTQGLQRYGGFL